MLPRKILFLFLVLVLIIGCAKEPIKKEVQTSCTADSDCACGVNVETRDCFYGNKNYVDVSKQCPDFCTGIAGNFEIKCVENECRQVKKEAAGECASDSDCVPTSCCHSASCVSKQKAPNCEDIFCTMVCTPNTLDCGQGSCRCASGKCAADINV